MHTPPPEKIKILLVDDHVVLRMGLMTATADQPDMEVVAEVETGHEAVEMYPVCQPHVVVLDLRMQGMNGIETIRALREAYGAVRVVIFSNFVRGEEIHQAVRAGASGFVAKEMKLETLLEAIRTVHAGEQFIPPEIATRMGERMPVQLSPRELDVLRLVARGRSNKEIGCELGVVEGTVKIHVKNILLKLGVADRTQAIVVAVQRGILQID